MLSEIEAHFWNVLSEMCVFADLSGGGLEFASNAHPQHTPCLVKLKIALWLVSTSSWLDDAAPCDLLEDKAPVLWAARMEAKEVIE